jgi:ubiquinone/menaquinone biosynthesis C-methylase UbiE
MAYISGGNELLDPTQIFQRLGVETGSKIADLGCGGAGHFVLPAAKLVGQNTAVYAVDILKSALRTVVSKGRLEGINNIKPVWSNLETVGATKIKEKSLDFVLLINILFQTKKPQNIFKEAVRLMAESGKLLVVDWGRVMTSFGPPPANRISAETIKKMAQDLNLKLIDEFQAGTYHYGLIFKQ